jgi:hypothetical protein
LICFIASIGDARSYRIVKRACLAEAENLYILVIPYC